ncbi:spore coat protein [Halobacillus halophilus]|uniref:spore coat protein n=1 Tax=Halobacillus halophilus TaxID=1570 RepID=UPI001CD6F784|nr:spore coat protein [Halobacillus halophilus]MCA1011986.1 spore coat protein [Halobacillus halophilus]
MSEDSSKKHSKPIPTSVLDLLISDIFRKNGVNEEKIKEKLSDEQKKRIKNMVDDLSSQVDSLIDSNKKDTQ